MADPVETHETEWTSTVIESAEPPEAAREVFGQRYRLLETVSRGPMGVVQRCRDLPLARDVAMKILPNRGSRVSRWRFLREARVQAQLRHPHIVPVHDIGVDEHGQPYFTMAWIGGETLRDTIQRGAPRDTCLAVLRQASIAVAHAHARGVVHRDLKPSNVRADEDGLAYLLDWGLAKVCGEDASHDPVQDVTGAGITREGSVLGTIGYMAPEQLRGEVADVDTAADVYALGAMLFEILAGEPIHVGKRAQRAMSILQTDGASPAARAPDRSVPTYLDAACTTATRLHPADRAVSAAELAKLLER